MCAFIRAHGGFENWHILRLALVPCSSSMEARTELRKHFDASTPALNKQVPTRTNREYVKLEKSKAKREMYRLANLEKIRELMSNNYLLNKEKIRMKRREYYIANTEACVQKSRAYREKKKLESIEE